MGPRYSPARSPRDSGYDSPGAYMSGGLGPRTRRASLREDILSQHDNGTRKSKSYADTVHPGDSISQVGRPTFVKPGQCVESSPHSRRLEQYEQSSRRGSRDDYGPTSPKSDSRRASYAGEHGAGRHQYKNRYGDNSCVEIGRDPRDFHCSGYGDSRIYQYKNSYGDKAGIEVQMDPVDMRRSGYRDDRSRTSYRGDNGGVVIVRRDITPPGSSSSSNRRSARASSGGASGGAYGRSSRSSGGPSSDSRAQFGRHWKDITYGDNRRFQHYDFRSGVKSHTTPDIGQDGVCGVAARDDSRGTLIVTEGRVNAYVKMPRMVFVECGKQALATFKHVSLERLREYADSIDNHSAPPMPGDRNRRGFWMDPQTLSLMVGRGTVERTVLDVEIAYLGSVSSARSSRAREIQRKRHEGKKDNEDLLRASSRWDSDYEAGRGSSHRRYSQRNIYYQDNDRYGRHY